MKKYSLFIDESGNLDLYNLNSRFYILCGTAVEDSKREELQIMADQIKFKYWGNTSIVFHSREISRNEGHFKIFKNQSSLKDEFHKDLLKYLDKASFMIFPVIVDKQNLDKRTWNKNKIVQKTANYIISNYLRLLLTKGNVRGKVIIEFSTVDKDRYYLSSFTYFTGPGCTDFKPYDYPTIQKTLTSISFVTKHNHDIEEQISDLLAYAVLCKYCEMTKQKYKKTQYEEKLIKILGKKLFKAPPNAGKKKKHFFDQIESFGIIPEPGEKK